MFTGLVEEVGQIRRIGRKGEAMVLNIGASAIMDDLKIGDSVAVNGVCLTATTLEGGGFTADVMPETYRHTNLSHCNLAVKLIWSGPCNQAVVLADISFRVMSMVLE